MNVGDILNYSYTGAEQSVTLTPGKYKLEVWGAAGGNGNNSTNYAGGKGGYATGVIEISASTTVYIYVGGKGKGSTSNGVQTGGWNGGGDGGRYRGGSGGGGTDIRIGGTALSNRVIVAGGGGGGCYYSGYSGGAGGGSSGGDGVGFNTSYNAKGGTQNGGGSAGGYASSTRGTAGSLGQGGAAATSSTNNYARSGGGGGGYYGGGGGGYRSSSNYYYQGESGGGGGSGYVSSSLSSTQNKAGTTSFTDPDGTTVTGHSGDGYARITMTASPLTPPTNLSQSAQTYDSVTISWDAVTGATGYKVYKDGTLVSTQAGTSYTQGSLTPGESHTYGVTAYITGFETEASTITASAKSLPTPTGLAVSSSTFSSISLSWNATDATGFHLYRGGTLIATTSGTSFTDSGLTPATAYSYSLKTYYGTSESSAATLTASTQAVPTPTGFSVTASDYTEISLSWNSTAATGFHLYRDGTLIATTSGTSYTDSGLMPDTEYTYTLKAYYGSAESSAAALTAETPFALYVERPEFSSALFTVNPVIISGTTIIQIEVADVTRILPPEYHYAGEWTAGEQ